MSNMIRYAPWIGWRTFFRVSRQSNKSSSSSTTAASVNPSPITETAEKNIAESRPIPIKVAVESKLDSGIKYPNPVTPTNVVDIKTSIVATAFANLKINDDAVERRKRPLTLDDRIIMADSVSSLLSIAATANVSRRHALRVVSILADWTAANRIKLSNFEADPRFVKLCKLLGRGIPQSTQSSDQDVTGFGDLAMVLGVTGDDEAAKLVAGISLNQMIKVLSTLALKRRRSTPLLRSLAFNIGLSEEVLDIKQGADILYAMAVLNFPDESLLERTCSNICANIAENKKSAVVGSVLTSLGRLRFKHTELLDSLSEWVVKNLEACRSQDLVALLLTLATVGHVPANADQLFDDAALQESLRSLPSAPSWLDVVWSLTVLDRAGPDHVASVLAPGFLERLATAAPDQTALTVAMKLKLLNVNAAARLLVPGYGGGPLLGDASDAHGVSVKRSKEKQVLVAAVMDSLSNLLPSATYLRTDVDTGMGFVMDGECVVDDKCNPLPVSEPVAGKKATRVAILGWDYGDMCRGSLRSQPSGVASLAVRLLEAKGFKVLAVPHTEFNPREKLVTRVQYLEQQLKNLTKERKV